MDRYAGFYRIFRILLSVNRKQSRELKYQAADNFRVQRLEISFQELQGYD